MSDERPYEVHPSVPCSRNLRQRTGVFLGVEAMEILWIGCLSMIPDILRRIGVIEKPNILAGILMSAMAFGFVVIFKRNKPPNYFTLWIHHHFLHPKGWRAPESCTEDICPILNELPPPKTHISSVQ